MVCRGGEANVAERAAVAGCLLLVVGETNKRFTSTTEAIWVLRLPACSGMLRIRLDVITNLLVELGRENSYLDLVHRNQNQNHLLDADTP